MCNISDIFIILYYMLSYIALNQMNLSASLTAAAKNRIEREREREKTASRKFKKICIKAAIKVRAKQFVNVTP